MVMSRVEFMSRELRPKSAENCEMSEGPGINMVGKQASILQLLRRILHAVL